LGGLWRALPWTAGLFTLGAAAIAGLPPLNGFVSEWLVFLGLFGALPARAAAGSAALAPGVAAWGAAPAAVLLGLTGALALACFVKVCGVVFLGVPRSEAAAHAHECGWRMRAPMVLLGSLCVAIGLAPAWFWPAIAHATAAWEPAWQDPAPPAPLAVLGWAQVGLAATAALAVIALWRRVKHNGLARAGTWDCGYAAPTPRMQYTAGSFAGILTGWFGWILRPQRHSHPPRDYFPKSASQEERTPETVLEQVVEPVGAGVLRLSAAVRRLQQGRLQAYILYLAVGLAALILIALIGAHP
jgi:hydrogenase-4 component B